MDTGGLSTGTDIQICSMQFRDHAAQVSTLWNYVPVIGSVHDIHKREITSSCLKILTLNI